MWSQCRGAACDSVTRCVSTGTIKSSAMATSIHSGPRERGYLPVLFKMASHPLRSNADEREALKYTTQRTQPRQGPSSSPRVGAFSLTHKRNKPSSLGISPRITMFVVKKGFVSPWSSVLQFQCPLSTNVPTRGSEVSRRGRTPSLPPPFPSPFSLFETGSQTVAQAGLKLTM